MFTCQPVPLGPAPRGGQGERCPPPQGSQGTRLHGGGAGFSEGGSVKSSRRKGILFRRKKGFQGSAGENSADCEAGGGGGGGMGAETTRKGWCWEEPASQEVQEVHRMRVMESFIAYSQGSSSFDKIILVPELPLALSVRALPFMTSSQLPFWSVTRPCCFFHSSAFSLFFFYFDPICTLLPDYCF